MKTILESLILFYYKGEQETNGHRMAYLVEPVECKVKTHKRYSIDIVVFVAPVSCAIRVLDRVSFSEPIVFDTVESEIRIKFCDEP